MRYFLKSSRKLFYGIAVSLGLGLAIALAHPAQAGGIVGNGTGASCTEAALNQALAGGDLVTFNCGISPVTIRVAEKFISTNTIIDGGGNLITLSGGGTNRVIRTADGGIQLTLRNITIANGFTPEQGGGVFNGFRGILTVENCTFTNNVSTQGGEFDGGGAIYTKSESTVRVSTSRFSGNRASNGGAINNLLSNLKVTDSVFVGNSSTRPAPSGGGAAIYVDGALNSSGKIVIRRSRMSNNISANHGGGMFVQLYGIDKLVFSQNIVARNTASGTQGGSGGGLFILGSGNGTIANIRQSTFSSNKASGLGAGLWLGTGINANLINNTIANNQAVNPNSNGGQAGGIAVLDNSPVTINNSTIVNNFASSFNGAIIGGNSVTLSNSIIANNRAGNSFGVRNNCSSLMTNGGNNIEFPQRSNDSNDSNCAAGIQIVDPLLGAFVNNGGLTRTIALQPNSPAVNGGNNATCNPIDQRSIARPRGGICDIGAFEL